MKFAEVAGSTAACHRLTDREDELTRELDEMLTRGGLGKRAPAVGKTFTFEQLPEALDFLRSGASVGKVVVTVEHADEHSPQS